MCARSVSLLRWATAIGGAVVVAAIAADRAPLLHAQTPPSTVVVCVTVGDDLDHSRDRDWDWDRVRERARGHDTVGQIRVVGPNEACRRGEVRLVLDVSALQGPPGTPRASGTCGSDGAAGTARTVRSARHDGSAGSDRVDRLRRAFPVRPAQRDRKV